MVFHSPPPSNQHDENPPKNGESDELKNIGNDFEPPTGRLAAVTRKGNELLDLIDNEERSVELLQTALQEYHEKIENYAVACDQSNLKLEALSAKNEYWEKNYSKMLNTRITAEKYISSLTGTRPKVYQSVKSQRTEGSNLSRTSSARVRLAEKKAKLAAKIAYEQRIAELEEKERELRNLKRKAGVEMLEIEQKTLENELDKLDNIAHQLEDDNMSTPEIDNHRSHPTSIKSKPNLTEVLKRQNEISLSIVKHQERAELPKRELTVFDGKDVTDYASFIQNFKCTNVQTRQTVCTICCSIRLAYHINMLLRPL